MPEANMPAAERKSFARTRSSQRDVIGTIPENVIPGRAKREPGISRLPHEAFATHPLNSHAQYPRDSGFAHFVSAPE